jgi:Protein of unknown function (DUF3311)
MPRPAATPGQRPAGLRATAVLLTAAVAGALWVPIYARVTPKLGPFPFFYWYQLVLIPVVALLCWICRLLIRDRPAPDPGDAPGGGAPR